VNNQRPHRDHPSQGQEAIDAGPLCGRSSGFRRRSELLACVCRAVPAADHSLRLKRPGAREEPGFHAIFNRPRSPTGNVAPLAERPCRVLMPGYEPVRLRQLLEQGRPKCDCCVPQYLLRNFQHSRVLRATVSLLMACRTPARVRFKFSPSSFFKRLRTSPSAKTPGTSRYPSCCTVACQSKIPPRVAWSTRQCNRCVRANPLPARNEMRTGVHSSLTIVHRSAMMQEIRRSVVLQRASH
jgi:hypothetical protein